MDVDARSLIAAEPGTGLCQSSNGKQMMVQLGQLQTATMDLPSLDNRCDLCPPGPATLGASVAPDCH